MDINYLIVWTVCLSCGLTIARTARIRDQRGWAIVSAAILVVTGVMLSIAPNWASLTGGSLWLLLVILPTLLLSRTNRLVYQQSYRQAGKLAKWVSWLHPADGLKEYPQLIRSLEMAQMGEIAAAKDILTQHQDINSIRGRYAIIMLYRVDAQWEELLVWIRDRFPEKVLLNDRDLIVNYIRALGETGDLNGTVQWLEKFEHGSIAKDPATLNTVRMIVLAFCGQVEIVERLFADRLKMFSDELRQFWLATAEIAAGREETARERLRSLSNSTDISLQKAVTWRLSHTVVDLDRTLTDSSKAILARIKTELDHEERYGGAGRNTGKPAYATYGLIGVNVLMFSIELVTGGSENIQNLYQLGGLAPIAVWHGEWWRLLSATFLHINFLHISLNMAGLYILGEFVEVSLGVWRYLVAYFFSGIGSMTVITMITMLLNFRGNDLTVGASGAIMGMVGATGAILLRGWLADKSPVAAKRLRLILFMIGLQVVFDLTTPHVSSLGHASGLVLGFLISLFLVRNPK